MKKEEVKPSQTSPHLNHSKKENKAIAHRFKRIKTLVKADFFR